MLIRSGLSSFCIDKVEEHVVKIIRVLKTEGISLDRTGNIVSSRGIDADPLNALIASIDVKALISHECKTLVADCELLLLIRHTLVPQMRPDEILSTLPTFQSVNPVVDDQKAILKRWAEIQVDLKKLEGSFRVGQITPSALGREPDVITDGIRLNLANLSEISSPPLFLTEAIAVGRAVQQVCDIYH